MTSVHTDVFVGKGTYGCVLKYTESGQEYTLDNIQFNPYFTKKTQKEQEDLLQNAVVKVMFADTKEIEKEHEMNQMILTTFDPDSIFTLPALAECDITIENPDLITNQQKCDKPKYALYNTFHAFVYPHGGVEIGKKTDFIRAFTRTFQQNQLDPRILALEMFIELTKGVKSITDKGYVHRDIKRLNILFDEKNRKYNLIDFGIACEGTQVYDPVELKIFAFPYKIFPPEFPLIAYLLICCEENRILPLTYINRILEPYLRNEYLPDELYTRGKECTYTNIKEWIEDIQQHLPYYTQLLCEYNLVNHPTPGQIESILNILLQELKEQFEKTQEFYTSSEYKHVCETPQNRQLKCIHKITPANILSIMNKHNFWKYVDIYSLGITFQEVYTSLEKSQVLEKNDISFTSVYKILKSMTHPDMMERPTFAKVIESCTTVLDLLRKQAPPPSVSPSSPMKPTPLPRVSTPLPMKPTAPPPPTALIKPNFFKRLFTRKIHPKNSLQKGGSFEHKINKYIENQDLRGYLEFMRERDSS